MLVSDVVTGTTPLVIGVNLGHHYPTDGSWVAYMEHLGVNGAQKARLGMRLRVAQGPGTFPCSPLLPARLTPRFARAL